MSGTPSWSSSASVSEPLPPAGLAYSHSRLVSLLFELTIQLATGQPASSVGHSLATMVSPDFTGHTQSSVDFGAGLAPGSSHLADLVPVRKLPGLQASS